MNDLIDRQQAIDVIDKEQKEIDVSDVSAMYAYSKCKTIIKQLPSVLGTNLAEVGTDLISRQQAIDALRKKQDNGKGDISRFYNTIIQHDIEAIMALPSAQPDIIRCRECKFASGDSRICMQFGHSPIGELDFCSFAEKREENNESN